MASWQITIEIQRSRSSRLNEIVDLAQRTASIVRVEGTTRIFTYIRENAPDCEIMLNKVGSWKSAVVFLNGKLVRAKQLLRALDCLLYQDDQTAQPVSVCHYCPIGGDCLKATRERLNDIVRSREVIEEKRKWKLIFGETEEESRRKNQKKNRR